MKEIQTLCNIGVSVGAADRVMIAPGFVRNLVVGELYRRLVDRSDTAVDLRLDSDDRRTAALSRLVEHGRYIGLIRHPLRSGSVPSVVQVFPKKRSLRSPLPPRKIQFHTALEDHFVLNLPRDCDMFTTISVKQSTAVSESNHPVERILIVFVLD